MHIFWTVEKLGVGHFPSCPTKKMLVPYLCFQNVSAGISHYSHMSTLIIAKMTTCHFCYNIS